MRDYSETVYGSLRVSQPDGDTIEVSTVNWPEASQEACLNRSQFEAFVTKCQEILARWPKREGSE